MELDEATLRELVATVMNELKGSNESDNKSRSATTQVDFTLKEKGLAGTSTVVDEVVIGLSPAFGIRLNETIIGVHCGTVLRELLAGIEENEVKARLVRVVKTADLAFIGHEAAKLSGSGIGIGVQSRGSALIHQKDLLPLDNLELFSQSPVMTAEVFRAIGSNAAKYAKGETPAPVPTQQDPMARPRYQAKSAVMHTEESKHIVEGGKPIELEPVFSGQEV